MSMPLLYERLSSLSTLQSSLLVELALLPSPRGLPMSMPLPSERLTFLLILKNEFSAPQSSDMSPVGRATLAPLSLEGHV